MKQFDVRRQQQLAWGLLLLATVVYTVEMSHQTILRYATFKATAFDLGNMDQVLWNTIHGRWFQFTNQAVDWYGPPTRLAVHFEPILLPLSLLYTFHADPRILLVFQTLALAAGALPIFLLTRRYLAEWPLLAPLMAMAYLLSPAVLGLNIFDFHPISLATPLFLYAFLALAYKRYGWFIVACIFACACKEDIPFYVAIMGIFLIWKYKLPRLGISLVLGGSLWSLLAFGVIIPHFYPGAQHNNFWYRYESLGSSPGVAIINVILHPWLLSTFITLDRLYYLASLLRSTGFLALLAPEWLLLASPGLAENLLSTDPLVYSGVYHYNAAIIPFVMLAAIHGTRRFISIWQRWRGEKIITETSSLQGDNSLAPGLRWATQSPIFLRLAAQWHLPGLSWRLLSFLRRGPRTIRARFARSWQTLTLWRSLRWQLFSERMVPLAKSIAVVRLQWIVFAWITLMIGLNYIAATPVLNSFWADHEPGSREQHIERLLAMIPPDASVSAGSNINPHVSERQHLAVFPSISDTGQDTTDAVQYIIIDLNAVFPEDRGRVTDELNHLERSGQYIVLARAEGVILLVRRSTAEANHVIIGAR